MIEEKKKGKKIKPMAPANDDGKVVDLMAALRKSLQGSGGARSTARSSTSTKLAAKKQAGKRVA